MIAALLILISVIFLFAAIAVFCWPFVDQDRFMEGMHSFYEERDR